MRAPVPLRKPLSFRRRVTLAAAAAVAVAIAVAAGLGGAVSVGVDGARIGIAAGIAVAVGARAAGGAVGGTVVSSITAGWVVGVKVGGRTVAVRGGDGTGVFVEVGTGAGWRQFWPAPSLGIATAKSKSATTTFDSAPRSTWKVSIHTSRPPGSRML